MQDIVEKFSTHLRSVIVRSVTLAEEQAVPEVRIEHLLYALSTERGSLSAEILQKTKIKPSALLTRLDGEKSDISAPVRLPEFSREAKRALEKAVLAASMREHPYVGTEHLLSAIVHSDKAAGAAILFNDSELKIIKRELDTVLKTTSKFPDMAAEFRDPKGVRAPAVRDIKNRKSKMPALDFFAVNLNKPEALQKMDPLIGREAELERVIQILSRRTKNNPILLGDPGVGKTALVEGLAKRIAEGAVPDSLLNKQILTIDLALLVAGTVYRGEFESRLKQVLDEAKSNSDVILFIDEVHMIVGAGAASGSLDAANILKPALARGEVRCIGATTLSEFKRHIEADAALERRFQPVLINETSAEETAKILKGLKERYESYHGVKITDEAISACVELSGRYIPEKFFPDKAIDLIDEAAAAKRILCRKKNLRAAAEIKKELARFEEEKKKAITEENFELALKLKAEESALTTRLLKEEAIAKESESEQSIVEAQDIARVAARITGIPAEDLLGGGNPIKNVEQALKQKIFGQEKIIESVTRLLERTRANLQHPNRPLASFLFLGPSGVGKTELAKVLGQAYFKSEKAVIRIDMSEFREAFQMSKLIGAPAGYVGYRDAAKMTDAVKARPYSLVLFDEIEKAHADVLNLLLQILEEGEISDAIGRKINFRNTIIVLTGNIGSHLLKKGNLGFGEARDDSTSRLMDELKAVLRPEFVNRLDQIHIFDELTQEAMEKIISARLEEINKTVAAKNLKLAISPAARAALARESLERKEGARSVRRILEERVEGALARILLEKRVSPGTVFTLKLAQGKVDIAANRA